VGLRIALGQLEARVGDVAGNVEEILAAWRRAADAGADLVVFTELAVTGYPPEDLLLKPEFVRANLDALDELARRGPAGTTAVVGYVGCREEDETDATDAEHWDVSLASRNLRNSAAVLPTARSPPPTTRCGCPTTGCSTRRATSPGQRAVRDRGRGGRGRDRRSARTSTTRAARCTPPPRRVPAW
jgi:hypothetical protein